MYGFRLFAVPGLSLPVQAWLVNNPQRRLSISQLQTLPGTFPREQNLLPAASQAKGGMTHAAAPHPHPNTQLLTHRTPHMVPRAQYSSTSADFCPSNNTFPSLLGTFWQCEQLLPIWGTWVRLPPPQLGRISSQAKGTHSTLMWGCGGGGMGQAVPSHAMQ